MFTGMVLLFWCPWRPRVDPLTPFGYMCIPPLFARGMRYVLFVVCSAFVLFYSPPCSHFIYVLVSRYVRHPVTAVVPLHTITYSYYSILLQLLHIL